MNKIVFGYVRVSGRGQVDGDGPPRQRKAIKDFCQRHGLPEPKFFYDLGVSGACEGLDRPGFSKMLVEATSVEGAEVFIVVETLQRLARDSIVSELAVMEIAKYGLKLYDTSLGFEEMTLQDNPSPHRKFIRQVLAAVAELDKTTLVLKLRVARERVKRATGKCEGSEYFGETNAHEQYVLQLIREARAAGSSWYTIAKWFNATNVKKRMGVKPWTASELCQTIRRDTFYKARAVKQTQTQAQNQKNDTGFSIDLG